MMGYDDDNGDDDNGNDEVGVDEVIDCNSFEEVKQYLLDTFWVMGG